MWVKNENQTLFCPGMPGAGKTIQTSVVVDHLQSSFQEDQKAGIAYFFFDYKRQDEQTINALLALFLKQLAASQSSLPEEVHKLYEKHNTQNKQTRPSTEELIGVLKSVITIYSRTFIMIDALDECRLSNGTRIILSCIYKLRSETKANFFITSRFNEDISGAFSGIPTLEIRASDEDVQRYLRRNMVYLPKFVYKDPSLQKEIIDSILKAVQGMFLVAQFHLGSLRGKTTPNQITLALQNLATGSDAYEQIYTKTMERIVSQYKEHKQLASSILSWLTFSKRPMRVAELQYVLGVMPKESYFDKRNMPSIELMVSVCAGLVTIDKDSNIIRLVHYTTQQYFQQTFEKWLPESHCELTIACITYFSYDVFKPKAGGWDRETLGSHPFYDYALLYWGDHAREDSILREVVMEFLKDAERIESYCKMSGALLPSPSGFPFSLLERQNTGLHLAAWFGLTAAVGQLLKSNTDIAATNRQGYTALDIAAGRDHKDVAQLLIDNKADIEANYRIHYTPLHIAAYEGREDMVRLLLDNNANIETVDEYGVTPLHTAIMENKTAVVQLLLDRDADIKTADKDGYTPLQLAVAYVSEPEITALLLSKGAQVDAPCIGQNGKTPLLMIVRNELHPDWSIGEYEMDIAQLLLRYGADIKATNEEGNTALHISAEGELELAELLLSNGAEVNATNDYGETPLFGAIISYYGELSMPVVQLLLNNGADVNIATNSGQTPLHFAVRSQEAITELLNKGANVHATDKRGRTPLFEAIDPEFWDEDRESVIQLLLDNGADVNAMDNRGNTPLLYAIERKHDSKQHAFQFLLINGANIHAADESGNTLLHQAVKSGHEVAVKLLLIHGANVHATNNSGKTPVFYAICNYKRHLVEPMLNHGANVQVTDENGNTLLHQAVKSGHEVEVELLLNHGANVQVTDENGNTPLHHAVQRTEKKHPNRSIAAQLLNKGAKVNAVNNDGKTPFFDLIVNIGIFSSDELMLFVKLLLGYGADVQTIDKYGNTPLHLAVIFGDLALAALLLSEGANANVANNNGKTPLLKLMESEWSKALNRVETFVQLLLDYGADLHATDASGRTVLDMALKMQGKRVVSFLCCKGASRAQDMKTEDLETVRGRESGEIHQERAEQQLK
ncbi:hypothetical protein TsFJ059_002145 [Trichoderma semiorbis]|nr:hypothetical protein TsFJ059_002145 [Trichoderma semiorbis]